MIRNYNGYVIYTLRLQFYSTLTDYFLVIIKIFNRLTKKP